MARGIGKGVNVVDGDESVPSDAGRLRRMYPKHSDRNAAVPRTRSEGGIDFLPPCDSVVNNRSLNEDTNVVNLLNTIWKMDHLEKGVSLIEGWTNPQYVKVKDFLAFKEAHAGCFTHETNAEEAVHNSARLWTDSWYLTAEVNELDDKVHLVYSYVKGTEPFKDLLAKVIEDPSGSYARWFYRTTNGAITDSSMKLNGNLPQSAFFPDVGDLHAFYDEYTKSTANVLLLIGPPGTGKTTFIRGYLQHCNINAWVTYDPSIQQDESFIVSFADPDDGDGRVLILEDCDTLMESRTEGNNLMNRILNLSDGIIQLPKRKLIFSTNLPSLDSVDDALLRPGRCFGAVRFRALKPAEATKAAASIGLERTFNANVTLAEAINSSNGTEQIVKRIGFT